MDFRHLKYFIAVAEEENISRAAKRLNISQPPLTRQIKQLEEDLDVSLFVRTPKGMELTEAGELFLEEARNIRTLFDLAKERTQRAAQGKLGRLDIAIFGSGILDAIPNILLAFTEKFPDVSIHLHQMTKAEQIEALRQKRITVGFNRLLPPLPDITSEPIDKERLLIAVNAKDPLSKKERILFKEMKDYPFILYPTGTRPSFMDTVISVCHEKGFVPKIAQEVGDAVASVALVASGFGICLVPESLSVLSMPGVVLRPIADLPDHVKIDLSCIYRSDDQSPLLKEFLKTARSFRNASASE